MKVLLLSFYFNGHKKIPQSLVKKLPPVGKQNKQEPLKSGIAVNFYEPCSHFDKPYSARVSENKNDE